MRQTFVVDMDDGTNLVIESDARDVRAWEAAYEQSYFGTRLSFTNIAQVAYLAGKRTGVLNGAYPTYEDFDAHCVDARGKREKDPPNPTPPDPTVGSSANSRSGSTRSRRSSSKKVQP